jgi:outer membrane protein assembly factor BamC
MVEDRNRNDGIYFVRYGDPEVYEKKQGFLGKLFKGGDDSLSTDEYQIILAGRGQQTATRVANIDGQPAPDKVSEQILTLLYEQLK